MPPAHLILARSNPFGLGPAESIMILIVLLVLFSGYALPQPTHRRSFESGLTRKEIFLLSISGLLLAAALAVHVWPAIEH